VLLRNDLGYFKARRHRQVRSRNTWTTYLVRRRISRRECVEILPTSRQREYSEIVQPWRRSLLPSRGLLGTCWCPSERVRTSLFTGGDRMVTLRRSWQWHPPQIRSHLRVFGGSSTNTLLGVGNDVSGGCSMSPQMSLNQISFSFYLSSCSCNRYFLPGGRAQKLPVQSLIHRRPSSQILRLRSSKLQPK